ncbi:MAG: hypothetical protein ACLSHC_02150 [Bilophila wadsworthia]
MQEARGGPWRPGGAGQFHSLGQAELPRLLVEVTKVLLGKMPVLGGWPSSKTLMRKRAHQGDSAEALIEEEIRLLAWSKSLMPAPPTDRLHGLIVEEMGKNFSGTESTPISSDGCALRAKLKWKARASGTFRY